MLGEINCDVPIDTAIESYKVEMADKDAAARYMASLELFKLIEKVGLKDADTTALPVEEKVKVKSVSDLRAPVENCVMDAEFDGGKFKKLIAVTEDATVISVELLLHLTSTLPTVIKSSLLLLRNFVDVKASVSTKLTLDELLTASSEVQL